MRFLIIFLNRSTGLRVLFAMRLRGVGQVRDGGLGGTNVLCVRRFGDLCT